MRRAYVWGAQIEQAAAPTTFIPTAGLEVTRMPDVVTLDDVSWLDAEHGTLRVIADVTGADVGARPAVCLLGESADSLCLRRDSSSRHALTIASRTLVGGTWPVAVTRTMLALWTPEELALWDDSAGFTVTTTTFAPRPSTISFGTNGTRFLDGHVTRVTYWPLRIPDADVAALE